MICHATSSTGFLAGIDHCPPTDPRQELDTHYRRESVAGKSRSNDPRNIEDAPPTKSKYGRQAREWTLFDYRDWRDSSEGRVDRRLNPRPRDGGENKENDEEKPWSK